MAPSDWLEDVDLTMPTSKQCNVKKKKVCYFILPFDDRLAD